MDCDTTYHTLNNGRTYAVKNTKAPYQDGEYPYGGFIICRILPNGKENYIDNAPSLDCVNNFLRAAERLSS